jgi:hypothetical protein
MAVCPIIYGVSFAVASAMATAGGWKSHIQLPGVLALAVATLVCAVGFFRIPWSHWWAKFVVLVAFALAANGVMRCVGYYWLFHLGHWQSSGN